MNKTTLIITLLNLVLFIGYVTYRELSAERLAYVDAVYLLNNYKGMIEARKDFQQKAATWKANVDTLASEMNKQIASYQKEAPRMTIKERSLSEELIRTKQQQLNEFQQAMNNKAQQEDEQMTRRVLDEVNSYIKVYGKKNGYTVILAATEYGNIAYANESVNITEDVLQGLNK